MITDKRVLDVMNTVHVISIVPLEFQEAAYEDRPLQSVTTRLFPNLICRLYDQNLELTGSEKCSNWAPAADYQTAILPTLQVRGHHRTCSISYDKARKL